METDFVELDFHWVLIHKQLAAFSRYSTMF